jgi:predicted amidohydrolase YtcJ
VDCRPEKVRTIDVLVAALKRKAERTPAGQWVTGTRYQETKLGRHPTRWDLSMQPEFNAEARRCKGAKWKTALLQKRILRSSVNERHPAFAFACSAFSVSALNAR